MHIRVAENRNIVMNQTNVVARMSPVAIIATKTMALVFRSIAEPDSVRIRVRNRICASFSGRG